MPTDCMYLKANSGKWSEYLISLLRLSYGKHAGALFTRVVGVFRRRNVQCRISVMGNKMDKTQLLYDLIKT